MKTHAILYILSAAFIGISMITGCNKPQESAVDFKTAQLTRVEVKDSEVTENVKKALFLDEKTNGFNIVVRTLKGDVRLTGFVDNQSQIDYMRKLVSSTEGVHTIHDELSIKKVENLTLI